MALTKADMAESLFNELGLNKREARELVDMFFEDLRAALAVGEQVKLSGFGNFDLRDKKQTTWKKSEDRGRDSDLRAPRGDVPSRTKTKSASRGLCWNPGITTNFLQSLESAISQSVK